MYTLAGESVRNFQNSCRKDGSVKKWGPLGACCIHILKAYVWYRAFAEIRDTCQTWRAWKTAKVTTTHGREWWKWASYAHSFSTDIPNWRHRFFGLFLDWFQSWNVRITSTETAARAPRETLESRFVHVRCFAHKRRQKPEISKCSSRIPSRGCRNPCRGCGTRCLPL